MERGLGDTDKLRRCMSVPAAVDWLCSRHGGAEARRLARLEQRKARQARSRKRFAYWAAIAAELDAGGADPPSPVGSAGASGDRPGLVGDAISSKRTETIS